MQSQEPRPIGAWLVLSIALAAGSCSSRGDSPAALTPSLGVFDVYPADGAVGVDPRSEVRVSFGELVAAGDAQRIVVADAAGPLPGRLDATVDGRTWRWRPSYDLPRAGRVEIRLLAGLTGAGGSKLPADRVFSFQVRDHVAAVEHLVGLGQEGTLAARAWRGGRRAVVDGRTLTEVDAAGVLAATLPVVGLPVAQATFSHGEFAALAVDDTAGLVLEVTRGTLNGPMTTVVLDAAACAHQRSELVASQGGDLGAYWYGVVPGLLALEGLWWSRSGTLAWQPVALPDAGTFPLRRLAIDGLGRPFVAYVNGLNGRLVLLRHDPSIGASELFDAAELPDSFEIGAAGNGEALVVWRESRDEGGVAVRLLLSRRYVPGIGLQAAVELHRSATLAQLAFAMADSGAMVVVWREAAGTASTERLFVLRVEADRSIGVPSLVYDGALATGYALAMAPRGEAWFVFVPPDAVGRDSIVALRSRPGQDLDALGTLHTAPSSGVRIGQIAAALDDGGRAVIAFDEERLLAAPVVRAIVID